MQKGQQLSKKQIQQTYLNSI